MNRPKRNKGDKVWNSVIHWMHFFSPFRGNNIFYLKYFFRQFYTLICPVLEKTNLLPHERLV